MNTKFSYTYRDGSNYKEHYCIVLSGEISHEQVKAILDSCDDREYFIPEQVGLECNRFGEYTIDDTPFCEIGEYSFESTVRVPTCNISVGELVAAFAKAAGNWDISDFAP